ncbi:hypothetical protein [Pseudomonas sp. zfem002]|uniref:hypothetical protein n=1 Tax=Pseudomonas sp. zfem002 TaxID=3078197 RepID=UPI0029293798|nr:hypothetical protein [Pseudomonas sp. zfem002]MDU9390984.1 hypothetical protein [Pseudomonas sp. zfem002]
MQQHFYITREDLAAFTLALDVRIYAGRGWLPLVLSAKTIIGDSVVAAVREDAGALRIELNRCSPPQREWLAEVEAASRMVCEICGKPGQLRFEGLKNGQPAGWHRTRCDEHIDDRCAHLQRLKGHALQVVQPGGRLK